MDIMRMWEKTKETLGFKQTEPVVPHSNAGVRTPDRQSFSHEHEQNMKKGTLNNKGNRVLMPLTKQDLDNISENIIANIKRDNVKSPQYAEEYTHGPSGKGVFFKLPDSREASNRLEAQMDRDAVRNAARLKTETQYHNENPYQGAVRDASSGKSHTRINSQETMAKGYLEEDKALLQAKLYDDIRKNGLSPYYQKAIEPPKKQLGAKSL